MGQELKFCSKCGQNRDGYSSWCKSCRLAYGKAWREANKDKINHYWEVNSDNYKVYKKNWREVNQDKIRVNNKVWKQTYPEKLKASGRAWQIANPDKANAISARRRAAKLSATPRWLTKDHLRQMQRYYTVAKWIESILNKSIHVDHIVPLQGNNVTGLHVPWNLQLLIAKDNISKGNK